MVKSKENRHEKGNVLLKYCYQEWTKENIGTKIETLYCYPEWVEVWCNYIMSGTPLNAIHEGKTNTSSDAVWKR